MQKVRVETRALIHTTDPCRCFAQGSPNGTNTDVRINSLHHDLNEFGPGHVNASSRSCSAAGRPSLSLRLSAASRLSGNFFSLNLIQTFVSAATATLIDRLTGAPFGGASNSCRTCRLRQSHSRAVQLKETFSRGPPKRRRAICRSVRNLNWASAVPCGSKQFEEVLSRFLYPAHLFLVPICRWTFFVAMLLPISLARLIGAHQST